MPFGGSFQETEGELTVSPLNVCLAEERLGEKVVGGSFPLKEGRDDRVEKEGEDVELWRMRERRDRFERVSGKKRKGQRPSRFDRKLKKLEWSGAVEDGGVYGPTVKVEREDFLSELGAIRGLWNEPWCVAGDFNMIRFPFERSRGGRLSPTMRRFSEVVEDLELRDLSLQGGLFTWSEGGIQVVLARLVFDHSPILLDGGGMRRGPTPFRFENMWLKEEGFEEVFGQIDSKKHKAWHLMDFWDKEESVRSLSLEEEEARKEMTSAHRRSHLTRVKVNGRWFTEESEIKEEVSRAFQGPLADPGDWKPGIDGLNFERLEEMDVEGLEKPFSEEEVFIDWAELAEYLERDGFKSIHEAVGADCR
ncbi:hypothetical protein CK203_097169 [Vitis vinifera]|uniref:DUF4283 domain-containing protein n=1 Tax=Vitis vinifera TaxID=29760 RepID=A0A438EUN8_VITVI|nr:hypothetical protein CK203_097169 [Vitis vinifera]